MGRDVTGLRIDKKGINQVKAQIVPNSAVERIETNGSEADVHDAEGVAVENGHEKQDVLAVKSTNYEPGLPDAKAQNVETLKTSEKKLTSRVRPASGSTATETLQTSLPGPITPNLSPEKQNSEVNGVIGDESVAGTMKTNDLDSTITARISQPMSPLISRRSVHHDEDDNLSLASSAATSVRTTKSRVTVPVAPSFVCANRAERRKEFYTKVEEKHKALEREKLEYAARTKEEEASAIKQLRKSMVVKANPVPSFYREGPPPKVELKKLPVTRAKSPNLTRRKSCSDATKTTPVDNGVCDRAKRHSVGIYKEGNSAPGTPKKPGTPKNPSTPKNKDVTGRRKSITGFSKEGSSTPTVKKSKSMLSRQPRSETNKNKTKDRPKHVNEKSNASRAKEQTVAAGADISVVKEEVTKAPTMVEHIADIAVDEATNKSPHATTDEISTDIATISEDAKKTSPTMEEEQNNAADISVEI